MDIKDFFLIFCLATAGRDEYDLAIVKVMREFPKTDDAIRPILPHFDPNYYPAGQLYNT